MLLRQILHWRMPYYIQKNVTRPRPAIKALTDETIRTIQAYNEMDDDLYRYGKELFQEQIALQGETLEKDVGRFQRINSLFSTYFRLVSIARRT